MTSPSPDATWNKYARAIFEHAAAKAGAEAVTDGHGHTVFKVRGKTFIYFGGPETPGVSAKLARGTRSQLVPDPAAGPTSHRLNGHPVTSTHYIGQHGWVDVMASDAKSLAFTLALIDESYEQFAAGATKKRAR